MSLMSGPIAAQVDAMSQKSAASGLPDDVRAVFKKDQARLASTSVPDGAIATGAPFPEVELMNVDGSLVQLKDIAGSRSSVVVFYRGAWCPYCNVTLKTYQEQLLPRLEAADVALIAISPQRPDGSLSMREKNELAFTVLSDPGNVAARAVGIISPPSDEVRDARAKLGIDLTVINADDDSDLPMPTTIVLDSDQIVRFMDVHPDYTTRTEPDDIIAELTKAGFGGSAPPR
jgi:peroxiredoxin